MTVVPMGGQDNGLGMDLRTRTKHIWSFVPLGSYSQAGESRSIVGRIWSQCHRRPLLAVGLLSAAAPTLCRASSNYRSGWASLLPQSRLASHKPTLNTQLQLITDLAFTRKIKAIISVLPQAPGQSDGGRNGSGNALSTVCLLLMLSSVS